jgi:hypothetical protein
MNAFLKQNKMLLVLVSIFIVVGFFMSFFHQHEEHTSDCAFCRLAQTLLHFFIAIFISVTALHTRKYFSLQFHEPKEFLGFSSLSNRAPPFIF